MLALPEGVALQQLMFLCPVQIRGELAALGERPEGAEVQARVCTLGEHLAAVRGGEARTACLLAPAVSDRVRYAADCHATARMRGLSWICLRPGTGRLRPQQWTWCRRLCRTGPLTR